MTTVHIVQSVVEVICVLLAAYAVYRLLCIRNIPEPYKPRTEAYSDKAVQFNARDFFSIDIKEDK